jgi:O-antigen/teichoic acid export membrane protein
LHAFIGVGLGRLQAWRSFPRIAVSLTSWSIVRIGIVVPAVLTGHGSGTVFLLALPGGLLVDLLLVAAFGAFRGVRWRPAPDGTELRAYYGLWVLVAWLLNADAVYARLFLSPHDAGAYAIAFTIGRLPVYAVAPLVIVLLPVTLAGHPDEQRTRLWAILGVGGLLLVATLLTIGAWPGPVLGVLVGQSNAAVLNLVRGYALVGSLAAAATLLVTFVFALGCAPDLRVPGIIAVLCLMMAVIVVRQPWHLLVLQGGAVSVLVAVYGYIGYRATAYHAATLQSVASK